MPSTHIHGAVRGPWRKVCAAPAESPDSDSNTVATLLAPLSPRLIFGIYSVMSHAPSPTIGHAGSRHCHHPRCPAPRPRHGGGTGAPARRTLAAHRADRARCDAGRRSAPRPAVGAAGSAGAGPDDADAGAGRTHPRHRTLGRDRRCPAHPGAGRLGPPRQPVARQPGIDRHHPASLARPAAAGIGDQSPGRHPTRRSSPSTVVRRCAAALGCLCTGGAGRRPRPAAQHGAPSHPTGPRPAGGVPAGLRRRTGRPHGRGIGAAWYPHRIKQYR